MTAQTYRDSEEKQITAYMLAAYRVYGEGETLTAASRDAKLDEQRLGRWVEYLKVKTRPELAKWHRSTDANRREIAAQYQEEFRRSAYQYDQDLSWWQKARTSFPSAGKIAGPRPQPSEEKARSSSLHGSRKVRCIAPKKTRSWLSRQSRQLKSAL